ncbi:MAG: lipid II flippase MurJ [Pseudomonadota bacterium]
MSVLRPVAYLAAALLLGRLLGLVREMLLARRVGVGAEADAAILVMTLPETLVAIALAGGFGAALVPALRRLPDEARRRLFAQVATLCTGVGLGGAVIIAIMPMQVIGLLAPALSPELRALYAPALASVGLAVPLGALAGALGAWCNVHERFFVVGFGTVVYNLVICALLLGLATGASVVWPLALATVLASLTRVSLLMVVARAPLRPRLRPVEGGDRRLLRLFVAGVSAAGIGVAAQLLFRTVAAADAPGELAAFSYALKLFLLPVVILFGPVATVLLPRFTDRPEDDALAADGYAVVGILALAALAVGQISGDAIAALLFGGGAMDAAGLARLETYARLMTLALPFAAVELVAAARLNAAGRTDRVLANALGALGMGTLAAALWGAMVGFLCFYGVLALLHLVALPPAWGAVVRRIGPMRGALVLVLVTIGALVDRTALPEDAVWLRVAWGGALGAGILLPWAGLLRRFGR